MILSRKTLLTGCAILLLVSCALSDDTSGQNQTLSGPFSHENLSVFFIHGNEMASDGNLLTLGEALEAGRIEVIETGSVGELQVRNLCDEPIFIQSGDIVKGGRQDRVLRYDIVLMPQSALVPIKSFCVEQGRWSARGNESVARFESSNNALASKGLKLAAKSSASQSEVWSQVAEVQSDLRGAFGASVADEESPTSLQLTLENDKLQECVSTAVEKLTASLGEYDNVVGFAFAINGEINSADIYGSPMLFAKMWPTLIEAAAMEALSNPAGDGDYLRIRLGEIENWLASSNIGSTTVQDMSSQVLRVIESDENVAFETKLEGDSGRLIHKNVIKK
jgi:hypothetical protein